MEKKKDKILELFFNSQKRYSFGEIVKKSKVSRPQVSLWLKKLETENLILKVNKKNKMPYYKANISSIDFKNKKRVFGLSKFEKSGFFNHLATLKSAKAVILFGSFSRSDWHEYSDVDIFIYGIDTYFEKGKYELIFGREIQTHTVKNQRELKKIEKLLPHIISGFFIKGSISDLNIHVHANT